MGLTTGQIITILKLPGVGRKTAFKICEAAISEIFLNDYELFDWLTSTNSNKSFPKVSNVLNDNFQNAVSYSKKIQEDSNSKGIGIISYYDDVFPKSLRSIIDPPLILSFKGNINDIANRIGVAIIGTREPNSDGVKAGEMVGKYFAEQGGFNVVSGLAVGCDTSAHRGCLNGNGFTTAILAHGLQTVYPKENLRLSEEIIDKGGLLLSEYLYGTTALPNYFVERDRLQAGLSSGTIVIQTDIKGGTMHAVRATLESKKFLGAISYNNERTIAYPKTFGNQKLIKSGEAMAITSLNLNVVLEKLMPLKNEVESEQDKSNSKIPIQTSCF